MQGGDKYQEWKYSRVKSERMISRGVIWDRVNEERLWASLAESEQAQAAEAESA